MRILCEHKMSAFMCAACMWLIYRMKVKLLANIVAFHANQWTFWLIYVEMRHWKLLCRCVGHSWLTEAHLPHTVKRSEREPWQIQEVKKTPKFCRLYEKKLSTPTPLEKFLNTPLNRQTKHALMSRVRSEQMSMFSWHI